VQQNLYLWKDLLEWFPSQATDMRLGMESHIAILSSALKTVVRQLATEKVRELCRQYHDVFQRKE
jgi:hypothetical protein